MEVLEHFEWDISYNRNDHQKILSLMRECGITWIRQEFRFRNETLTDSVFAENYLQRCDTLMKLYKNDSISVLILFTADSARQVAEGFDNKSGTSALSDAFLRFVGRVVNRYKQQTVSYEILNEPNSKLSPELYAALLKKASSLIRSTTSKAQIIYGGLDIVAQDRVQFNKIEKWGWSGYLQRTQELGCGSYYDYFSFHPFVFPRNPVEGGLENLITTAAKILRQKNMDYRIWISNRKRR